MKEPNAPRSGKARKPRAPNWEPYPHGEQVRLYLSPDSLEFLRAQGERLHLPVRSVVDLMVTEQRRLARELEALEMANVGELLVALRELRGAR